MTDRGPTVHLEAFASGSGTIYLAAGDQYIAERDLHLHYWDGVHRVRRVRPGSDGPDDCPYPGMSAFTAEQAAWFFGRDRVRARLVGLLDESLRQGGAVAVVAPSGAGKSSLLRAGLVPALARGALPGSRRWPCLVFTPTAEPLVALTMHLAALTQADPAEIGAELAERPTALADRLREVLEERGADRLVLIVDQVEELFTQGAEDTIGPDRQDFLAALGSLAQARGQDGPLALVVYGVRADFYARCAPYPSLREALEHRQVFVGPMSATELREAILHPARSVGLDLEEGLVELLLTDLGVATAQGSPATATQDEHPESGYESGRLPLLAHALRVTWQQRHGSTLTVAGYRAAGRIQGAVAETAERAYRRLSAEARRVAEPLFRRLVRIGEDTADTRRTVRADRLTEGLDPQGTQAVLSGFTEQRLLTMRRDTVEITHEALLTAWPRLRSWVDADRAGLLVQQRLGEDADSWHHDNAALYRGSRLELARDWAASHPGELRPVESEFLAASDRAGRRRRRWLVGTVTALVGLLVASLAATVLAIRELDTAQERQRRILAHELVGKASGAQANDPRLALQLSIAADRIDHSPESTDSVLRSLLTPYAATLVGHGSMVRAARFSPDGRVLATGGADSTVLLWDTSTPHPEQPVGTLHAAPGGVNTLAFSPDGHTLAVGAKDSVDLWNVSDPHKPVSGNGLRTGHGRVWQARFSGDGRILATADEDGTAVLWSLDGIGEPQPLGSVTGGDGGVSAVSFGPDGRTLAIGNDGGTELLWDIADPHVPRRLGQPLTDDSDWVTALTFSPDGHRLASGGGDGVATLWDVSDLSRPAFLTQVVTDSPVAAMRLTANQLNVLGESHRLDTWDLGNPSQPRHTGQQLGGAAWSTAAAMSPDLHMLATGNTGSTDNTVVLWRDQRDIRDRAALDPIGAGAWAVTFSPDGHTLAVGGGDGSVVLWDVQAPDRPRRLAQLTGGTTYVDAMAFAPDGTTLATGSTDATITLWDTRDPEHPREISRVTAPAGVRTLAFQPGGHRLADGDGDGGVTVWDVTDPAQPVRYELSHSAAREAVGALAFSPDGRQLASGGVDGTVTLYALHAALRHYDFQQLPGHTAGVDTVAFSPDGHTLAVGSSDASIILYDTTKLHDAQQLGQPLTQHASWVRSVVFSPDGHTLISGSNDGTFIIWDTTDRTQPQAISTSDRYPSSVVALALAPGGPLLASADQDGTVHLTDLSALDDLRTHAVDRACARVGQGLSRTDWSRYLPGQAYRDTCPS